jgi:plastocyanin
MAVCAALVLSTISTVSAAPPRSKAHVIVIEAMQFTPARLEVTVGDTVIWRNKDAFAHNARTQGKAIRSPDIPSGGSWKFKAGKQGVFPYVCTLHPGMMAVLVVN